MFTEILRTIVLPIAVRILLAVLVLLIGRWLAKRSQRWLTNSLQNTPLTVSFVTLIKAMSYYAILILTGVVILAILGVPIPILAGAVGLIVIVLAIALKTSLGNLAATVNFLLFKPFEIGDVIETGGVERVKKEFDGAGIFIPFPQQDVHLFIHSQVVA